jgi:hypothetical protein
VTATTWDKISRLRPAAASRLQAPRCPDALSSFELAPMSTTSTSGSRRLSKAVPTSVVSLPRIAAWRRRGGRVEFAVALAGYALTAAVLTWPLVLHIGSSIYLSPGRPYGDYTGEIANLHALLVGPHNPFVPGTIHSFNAPEGLAINWVLDLATIPEITILYILGGLFGATSAFDLEVLLGFIASGVAMFALVRERTGRFAIALLIGWAFAFYPFAVASGEHPDYLNGWPLVLLLWAGLRALDRPTVRRGAVAGAATILGLSWTPYFLLIGGVAFAAEVVAALVIGWRERRLRAQAIAFGVATCMVGVYVALILVLSKLYPGDTGQRVNSLFDVIAQSSRPLNYVLAPPWNHFLGHWTGEKVIARGWAGAEKTLYVGLSLVLLALIAVFALLRRRLNPNHARAVFVAGLIAVVAAFCSGPPQVAISGHLVNMPSWYLFHLTGGFRIYSRFVIVLEMCLCVMAGIGLVALLPRRRPLLGAAVLVGVAAVVVLDLWGPIPEHFGRLSVPRIYATLAKQPPGIYADYPIGPVAEKPDYHDIFFQAYAGHPILNGSAPGSVATARNETLADLALPTTSANLLARGVRYVLVEHHPLPPFEAVGVPERGYDVIDEEGYATLYRVTGAPSAALVPLAGFSVGEGASSAVYRWITAPTARLEIKAPCAACKGDIEFGVASFVRPRVLTVVDETNGRLLKRVIVDKAVRIRVPLSLSNQTVLRISTSPGPQSIAAAFPGSPDTRDVSVNVQAPQVRVAAGGRELLGSW